MHLRFAQLCEDSAEREMYIRDKSPCCGERALDHWESLIKTRTASPSVIQSPLKDPLQELAAKGTFEDRVAMLHNLGPRSHIDFPFEGWTISLALFFEGLLGDTYMPFPFKDLVDRLRAVNRRLYDTISCSE